MRTSSSGLAFAVVPHHVGKHFPRGAFIGGEECQPRIDSGLLGANGDAGQLADGFPFRPSTRPPGGAQLVIRGDYPRA